jgi:hypothetical protein
MMSLEIWFKQGRRLATGATHASSLLVLVLAGCASARVQGPAPARAPSLAQVLPAAVPRVPTSPTAAYLQLQGARVVLLDSTLAPLADLTPQIVTAHAAAATAALKARPVSRVPTSWKVEHRNDGSFILSTSVTTDDAEWRLALSADAASPQLSLVAEVRYLKPVASSLDAVDLRIAALPQGVSLDRAYRLAPIATAEHVVDLYTPQVAWFGDQRRQLSVVAHAQNIVLRRRADKAFDLRVELDNALSHPFQPFRDCWAQYHHWEDRKRDDFSALVHAAGDRARMEVRFFVARLEGPYLLRFPRGFRAALAFTDHADQSSLPRLAALMYGDSTAPRDGHAGFARHGLSMTKTVFYRTKAPYAPQLDDPAYRALVTRLMGDGIEVGTHSVSGKRDSRKELEEGLTVLAQLTGARVWIDHQPETKCEAVASRGYQETSEYHTTDLLQRFGYRYVWADTDVSEMPDHINLFAPELPRAHTPILYRHKLVDKGMEPPLYLFSAVWRAEPLGHFLAHYAPRELDLLESERGIHIAHTYLDTFHTSGHMAAWNLLEEMPFHSLRLKKAADDLFKDMQQRQEQGRLWVAGVGAIADHLLAIASVRLEHGPGGAISVVNGSDAAIRGLSLLSSPERGWPLIDGVALPRNQLRDEKSERVFWFDLGPRQTVHLEWRHEDESQGQNTATSLPAGHIELRSQ